MTQKTVKPGSIRALAAGLKAGEFTALELAENCLDRIAARDDDVRAFIKYDPEQLRKAARGTWMTTMGLPSLSRMFTSEGRSRLTLVTAGSATRRQNSCTKASGSGRGTL